ncbi:MAG: FAD-dependent oxidoreductase, partial [Chrysiogenetes bacterium]|nr:FAD-dependent oxidoreductase [Chrysiogenetes bacterium]
RLVYPVPGNTLAGLGVHLTPTPAGELLVGPNARWIASKDDYESDREGPGAFLQSAQRLLPALEESDLRLGYTGIRPKLTDPGEPSADFEIARLGPGGRFLSLRGIESPGLTAAPALAEEIAEIVHKIAV